MTSFQSSVRRSHLFLGVALLGVSLASTSKSHAAIVSLDLGPSGFNILGLNGGVAPGNYQYALNFPVAGSDMLVYNNVAGYFGLNADRFEFAITGGYASPQRFGSGDLIDGSIALWSDQPDDTVFQNDATTYAPDFGAGSFMAFRFGSAGNYNYGWIEVLWDSTATAVWNTTGNRAFMILGAAYESDVNTAILAGAGAPSAIPLPGAAGLAACGLLGLSRRRRR